MRSLTGSDDAVSQGSDDVEQTISDEAPRSC